MTQPVTQPALYQNADTVAGVILDNAVATIHRAAANAPRSQQVELGPSEIGTPCTRRLGYGILGWPEVNSPDHWAAVIGTSVHAWLADVYTAENVALGRERYLVEREVAVPWADGWIKGHSDLYDRDVEAVIDWKVPGITAVKDYRKNGPGDQYRAQAHLYGLGRQLQGETPKWVANAYLTRAHTLKDAHVWCEPYDPQVAVDTLNRLGDVLRFHEATNTPGAPPSFGLLSTSDGAYCTYCPWFAPGSSDLSIGCPGHPKPPARSAIDSMLA